VQLIALPGTAVRMLSQVIRHHTPLVPWNLFTSRRTHDSLRPPQVSFWYRKIGGQPPLNESSGEDAAVIKKFCRLPIRPDDEVVVAFDPSKSEPASKRMGGDRAPG